LSKKCFIETLTPRIGKVQAAIGFAHHVIGTVEALVVPAVGQDGIRAVRFHTGHPAVDHFTDDDSSLYIEGHAVGFATLLPDDLQLAPGNQFEHLATADVDKQQVTVRVP